MKSINQNISFYTYPYKVSSGGSSAEPQTNPQGLQPSLRQILRVLGRGSDKSSGSSAEAQTNAFKRQVCFFGQALSLTLYIIQM